ncbi:MAG: PDZ domain-containing protein [Chloroflexi bacterium]|nr:PDZ domain-containing protein [Chloroflexota bacterium]
MNFKRYALVLLFVFTLSCNSVTRVVSGVTPVSQTPATQTPAPDFSPPVYIPSLCQNIPLATIPPATALAEPTPFLQANPEIERDLQFQVFDEVVSIVEEVYVYEDFNGKDWPEMASRYRGQVEAGLDTETFYNAMHEMIIELGDEHSWLESPVEVAEADAELAGTNQYVGIGVYFIPMLEKQRITVISVFPDSPAEHNGLKPHDSIITVDGLPIAQGDKSYDYLVRGPECSATVLTVQTPGEQPREITFVRQRIQSPYMVEARLLPTSDGSRVGYLFIPTFFDETIPGQIADALEGFGTLDGLILDNRMNGGGSSSVVNPVFSYFVSGALGEFTSRKESRSLTIEANPIQNSQTVPLVVLVSEETASFGEIFSGVLKDLGRAQIVGQATLGNVEILHGYNLSDGSRLWIAEETFTPVNLQDNWEVTGIVPDVEAYADWDTFTFENDPSVAAALELLGH